MLYYTGFRYSRAISGGRRRFIFFSSLLHVGEDRKHKGPRTTLKIIQQGAWCVKRATPWQLALSDLSNDFWLVAVGRK